MSSSPPSAAAAAASPETKSDPLIAASYATMVGLWAVSQVVYVPFVLHLLTLVTAILYAACHASLALLGSTSDTTNDSNSSSDAPNSNKAVVKSETLQKGDAYQFPLVGSLSLGGLYLCFKFLDKEWVNFLIGGYFLLVGCLAVTLTLVPAFDALLGPSTVTIQPMEYVPSPLRPLVVWLVDEPQVSSSSNDNKDDAVTLHHVQAFVVAACICGAYFYTGKPWYLNNILGICFSLQGISKFSLGTFSTAGILLVGLFFYDIFWVFGTEVMVTVAKNLDGPIKLLLPRNSLDIVEGKSSPELSLLGLGDIVIPGFFLALLLRFDAHQSGGIYTSTGSTKFPKPYFTAGLVSYTIGLGTTLFVMFAFDAAQPALLYLVPACLGSSLLCAAVRGEISVLLAYSEEEEEQEEEEKPDNNEDAATTKDEATEAKKDK